MQQIVQKVRFALALAFIFSCRREKSILNFFYSSTTSIGRAYMKEKFKH